MPLLRDQAVRFRHFLHGRRCTIRTERLPDGSSKKKTTVRRTWPGLLGWWRDRSLRFRLAIWAGAMLVCALLIFGELLDNRWQMAIMVIGGDEQQAETTQEP